MSALRSRARLIAIAWLLCQVASLSAFMPEDCCEKHMAAVAKASGEAAPCHDAEQAPEPEPEPGDDCPMKHGTDEACPMHRSSTDECCGMSSVCNGPNRPLATLFSFAAVLDAPEVSVGPPRSSVTVVPRPAPLLGRLVCPDAPPPKV